MSRAGHALAVIVALFSCAPALAQTGTGDIQGRVAADSGELLENATVTLTDVDTGVERKTRSDDGGRFAFVAVAAGRYQVTAEHRGFAPRTPWKARLFSGQFPRLAGRAPLNIEMAAQRGLAPRLPA